MSSESKASVISDDTTKPRVSVVDDSGHGKSTAQIAEKESSDELSQALSSSYLRPTL